MGHTENSVMSSKAVLVPVFLLHIYKYLRFYNSEDGFAFINSLSII